MCHNPDFVLGIQGAQARMIESSLEEIRFITDEDLVEMVAGIQFDGGD